MNGKVSKRVVVGFPYRHWLAQDVAAEGEGKMRNLLLLLHLLNEANLYAYQNFIVAGCRQQQLEWPARMAAAVLMVLTHSYGTFETGQTDSG